MNNMKKADNPFDTLAATWDEDPGKIIFAGAVAEKIRAAVPVEGGRKALEFGCGTGLVTVQLAPALESVLAVDSSERMLEKLDDKIRKSGMDNIRTCHLASEGDPLPGEDFSLVFSNMVLHHVEDYRSKFRLFYDALAPGGYVAVSDLDTEDGSFHGEMEGVFHHGFSREEFVRGLEAAGFENCRTLTVFTIPRETDEGLKREYPVFMVIGQKP